MKGPVFVTRLAALGLLGAAIFSGGCGGGEQIFPTGSGGSGGSGGAGATGGSTMQGGSAGSAGSMQGGAAGTTMQGGAAGSTMGECAAASDCDTKYGVAACGGWACNGGTCALAAAGCTDADHDGFGTGASCTCAALDCDDLDTLVGSSAAASCYSGPAGTENTGTCHAGTTTCSAGVWSPCSGEVTPSGEACNNQDDDCNGAVDDGLGMFSCGIGACKAMVAACTNGKAGACVPGPAGAETATCDGADNDCDGVVDENCKQCVPVTPTGNDATANGTFAQPFGTIQAAISYAANNAAAPRLVCVAGGATCNASFTYTSAQGATITMADGVGVVGSYESTNWTQCNNLTTTIAPQTPEGVTFPAAVQKTTALDGFVVNRFNATTTSGVTVNGAKGAILSNVTINNTPTVTSSYGVNVVNGGAATITRSHIDAGIGTSEAIGVRSVGSNVQIDNNCLALDAGGRCDDHCNGGVNPSIRGCVSNCAGTTYAVLLQDSPGSLVQATAMCGNDGQNGASVRIAGDGTGIVIRGNLTDSWGGALDSHGIWMEDCNDAAPWIVDNYVISANGDTQMTRVNAIRAIGACHPVVDSNVQITSGGEGQAGAPIGVYCGVNGQGVASKCVVLGNPRIEGSAFGFRRRRPACAATTAGAIASRTTRSRAAAA